MNIRRAATSVLVLCTFFPTMVFGQATRAGVVSTLW